MSPTSAPIPGTSEQVTTVQAWKTAARVHTLPAAIVPVAVGAGLAIGDGVFRWDAFLLALIAALAIQVAANFANDVSDAHRGADSSDRVGPPRMVALGQISPGQMWAGVAVSVTIAAIAGVGLYFIAGPVVLVIGLDVTAGDARLCRRAISLRVSRPWRGVRIPVLWCGRDGGEPLRP